MARRVRFFRRQFGESQLSMAQQMHIPRTPYRCQEMGIRPVTADFLLRFQMSLGLGISELWFPVEPGPQCIHPAAIRDLMQRSDRQTLEVTVQDVLTVTAEVFRMPLEALKSGLHHQRLIKARTAAAFVVSAHPWLRLTDLAQEIRRTADGLKSARYSAIKRAEEGFWSKVAAVQEGVD